LSVGGDIAKGAAGGLAAAGDGTGTEVAFVAAASGIAGAEEDDRVLVVDSLGAAAFVAGPVSGRKIDGLKHPVDRDQQRIPTDMRNARMLRRSRGIERPLWETGCIAHTLR
jgi:hypothetical protein